MKKYYICSYLDFIHTSLVDTIIDGVVTLKDNVAWNRITAKNKITYQSVTETPTAGPILKETITISSDVSTVAGLLDRKENYIIRLFIDNAETIVGTLEFPARKIYSDDKIRATITFSRVSPL